MGRSGGRRRIEIGWFEAVGLMVGYVASLAVVGVAGMYIGERSVQQRLGAKERIVRIPISPKAPGADDGAEKEPDITFYDTLAKRDEPVREGRLIVRDDAAAKTAPTPTPGAKGVAPATGGGSQKAPAPGGGPAKPAQRAGAGVAPPTPGTSKPVASQADAPAPAAPRTAMPRPPEVAALPTAKPVPVPGAEPPPAGSEAVPPPAGDPPALAARTVPGSPRPAVPATEAANEPKVPAPEESPAAPPRTAGSSGGPAGVSPEAAATAKALLAEKPAIPAGGGSGATWSAQVNATQDQRVARELTDRLRRRGYDAYMVTQVRSGATWYRVRVGRLSSLEMANGLVSQLKQQEGLSSAFVASD
jgi:hypothetical protein